LTSETQTKAKVIVEVPIYDYPDPFEDIYMKTDRNPAINPNLKQHNIKRSRDEVRTISEILCSNIEILNLMI
jgi:hypothetical protein